MAVVALGVNYNGRAVPRMPGHVPHSAFGAQGLRARESRQGGHPVRQCMAISACSSIPTMHEKCLRGSVDISPVTTRSLAARTCHREDKGYPASGSQLWS